MAGDAPAPQACTVKRLIIEPKPDRLRRLAILDRDIEVACGLAAGLPVAPSIVASQLSSAFSI